MWLCVSVVVGMSVVGCTVWWCAQCGGVYSVVVCVTVVVCVSVVVCEYGGGVIWWWFV